MIPGQTYVGRLPGDSRPSFVRKRQTTICDALGKALSRYKEYPPPTKMMSWSMRKFYPKVTYECYPRRYKYWKRSPDIVPDDIEVGRLATTTAQVCAACGKHRSPGWSSRHPLSPGGIAKPGLCKKCHDKSTSSEDSDYSRRGSKKRRHHRHHRWISSDEDWRCSRASPGHAHSHGRYYSHGRRRSASCESAKIHIENSPQFQHIQPVVSQSTSSSDDEEVHFRRRSAPQHGHRKMIVEDVDAKPYHRRASHSSVQVLRSSRSKHFRPRHSRRHSTSHVSFADEPDEVFYARSRSPVHRRAYYDGANSGESEFNNTTPAPSVDDPESDTEETLPVFKTASDAISVSTISAGESASVKLPSFKERMYQRISETSSKMRRPDQRRSPPSTADSPSQPEHFTYLSPDHPDHPDHLMWLLATNHISASHGIGDRDTPITARIRTWRSASPPLTPIFDEDSFNMDTPATSFQTDPGYDHTKPIDELDYDEAEYWAAQGRAHMENLLRQRRNSAHV